MLKSLVGKPDGDPRFTRRKSPVEFQLALARQLFPVIIRDPLGVRAGRLLQFHPQQVIYARGQGVLVLLGHRGQGSIARRQGSNLLNGLVDRLPQLVPGVISRYY